MFGKSKQLEALLQRAARELQAQERQLVAFSQALTEKKTELAAKDREIERLDLEVERWRTAYTRAMEAFAQRALGLPSIREPGQSTDPFAEDPKLPDSYMSPPEDHDVDVDAIERALNEPAMSGDLETKG